MITLRFVDHGGVFGGLCRLALYGFRYTHVEVETECGYLGAMLLGGVKVRPKGYDAGKFVREAFIRVNMTPNQESAFWAFMRSQIGKPYDPISIVYFWGPFAGRNWHETDAWTCSEYIAEGFVAAGMLRDNPDVPVCRVTPQNIYWFVSSIAEAG